MPIQFQCPHCKHAMQLPDTAAGKQGKCPKCSNAVTVPTPGAAATPPNPHDAEFWSELDEKKDAIPNEDAAPEPVKKSDAQILKHMLGKAEQAKVVKRIGLPWERPRDGGMFDRYWDTAIGVMNHTLETFAEMKITGGIGGPLKFLILGAIFGSLIAAVYGLVGNAITTFGVAGAVSEIAAEEGADEEAAAVASTVVTAGMIIIMVLAFFGTFFGGILGGLIHGFLQAAGLQLALPIVGVKQPSFEKNFRIVAYTNGSIYLCNIVPGLGVGFMTFLWFKGMIKGIESVYEVPTKTAVLAVLLLALPLVFPIIAVVGFFALMMLGYIG
ncbi:MAG: hypothetical protein H8E66_09180 [Planctomycetes bacterium]|nr:hypothetical protein [Planctomycetota bacterium]